MSSISLDLTSSSSKLIAKLLDNVPMNQRDAVWNQLNRDVRRINEIWSRTDKQNRLSAELAKSKSKSSPK